VLHRGAGAAAYLCAYSWAWVRHVLEPDEPDLPGYLADMPAGGKTGGDKR
jgi:hypothetical protein